MSTLSLTHSLACFTQDPQCWTPFSDHIYGTLIYYFSLHGFESQEVGDGVCQNGLTIQQRDLIYISISQFYEWMNKYSSPLLCMGDTSQNSQWMPEIADSTEPYIYYIFSYIYI